MKQKFLMAERPDNHHRPFKMADKTIAEIGSFDAALARELHYWLSKLITLEYRLKELKSSGLASHEEKAEIASYISSTTQFKNYDTAPPSSQKLIAMRALAGRINEFLELAE